MAIEVFNRYENKYMPDCDTAYVLQKKLSDYMELDEYNKRFENYTVCNIYYDTTDSHLIRTSLSKPKYKEKLRLRAYGIPDLDSKVYGEIKKKFAGIVNKRRSELTLYEAYDFFENRQMPELKSCHNKQVLSEIAYILDCHKLQPALFLAYDRKAYFSTDNHDLRISFDSNIRSRDYDLRLEYGDYGDLLLEKNKCLMEIKSAQSIPLWLCRLMSEYKIYPASFSKYGAVHMEHLEKAKPQKVYAFTAEKNPMPKKRLHIFRRKLCLNRFLFPLR